MVKKAIHIIFFTLVSGITLCQTPVLYEVTRMPFSDKIYSDISPVIFRDGVLFCSNRRFSALTDRTGFDGRRLYNIYSVSRRNAGWTEAKELGSERDMKFNSGPLSISGDGRSVYFTSEVETGNEAKKRNFRNRNGIFIGKLSANQITSITAFRFNSNQYDVAHPSISRDGNILFFASNMPGGQGRSDIWFCELINGEWSTPVNAGLGINTQAAENYPFINSSGKLYFSSDRGGGVGKLDIYFSSNDGKKWEAPVRLPEPVNSKADDFAFMNTDDQQTGYFSSNRLVNDDIYSFRSAIIRKAECGIQIDNSYCYEFAEENAVKYDTIPFLYKWKFSDGINAEGRVVEHCFPGPGKYIVQLDVVNLITGEIITNQKTDTLDLEDEIQPYISSADTIKTSKPLKLDSDKTNLPGWNIERFYWNFGDETVTMGQHVEKIWKKPGVYNVQLIVNTRQDSRGEVRETCISKDIIVVP